VDVVIRDMRVKGYGIEVASSVTDVAGRTKALRLAAGTYDVFVDWQTLGTLTVVEGEEREVTLTRE
jgi:hypothetical protein